MDFEDINDDIDVHIERDLSGKYTARLFHKLSMTIKISDPCDTQQEAIEQALEELLYLIKEKKKGLGR